MVEKEIKETLPLYLATYREFVNSGKFTMTLSEDEDGKPILAGLRYKLLALLLIAGDCELTDTNETVCQVAKVALDQKKKISELPTQKVTFTSGEGENKVVMESCDNYFSFLYMTNASLIY